MKPQTIFIFSLVGNLSLGATAFHFLRDKPPAPPDEKTKLISTDSKKRKSAASGASDTRPTAAANYKADEFSWHYVESQDFKDYIANLRSVECPEETIRDIITADVNKLYAGKLKELRGPEAREYKYWKSDAFNHQTEEGYELQKKYRELEKEKSALLIELLGVDPNKERNKEMGYLDYMEKNYSFLSEEKKEMVRKVQEKFEEQKQKLYRRGIIDDEDQKELKKINDAQTAEMAKFLTPLELEQYEMRASQTATQLRYDLDAFEPNENEFREIFQLRKAREEDLSHSYDPDDKEAQERRKKAAEEVDQQIKARLGEQRFDEYKRAQDWSYKELTRLTERAGLPKESANSVYDMKKVAEGEVKKIREDKTLTNEQRTQALQAIREETEKTIIATLGGEKNFNRYKSRGGYWISNLAPTPRPATATR